MYVMMLFAVVMGSVVLSSCGEDKIVDEDGNYTDRALVGKWKSNVKQNYEYWYIVFELKSNGKGNMKEYVSDDNKSWVIEDECDYTWTYDSETCKLFLFYDGGDDEVEEMDVEWIDKDKVKFDGMILSRQ